MHELLTRLKNKESVNGIETFIFFFFSYFIGLVLIFRLS